MYELNFNKRVWIVKQRLRGIPAQIVASSQGTSIRTVQKLVKTYNEGLNWDSLNDHKTGRPETILNPNAVIIILDLRKRFGYCACHIEQILRKHGFSISHRQIDKVLIRNDCVIPNVKKQKASKWVRYELPNPNDLWHTDWSYDPFTTQQLGVYIDDRTRLVTSYGIFKRATAENTIALLHGGIAEYGKPKSIMTDHGSQYYANHPNAEQENTEFRKELNLLGIKHYLARVNRPQTNGKVERFFLTYKTEYATGAFKNIKDYITHYNGARPHMSLNYKTPKEIWDELKNTN